jgi:hypothetical protein
VQLAPAAHWLPQLPQFVLLVEVSTQRPLQSVCPVAQPEAQLPPTHWLPGPQRLPHAPQLRGSVEGSVHCEPHSVVPAEHAHAPLTHAEPVGQEVLQLPQSNGSLVRSTQAPLQLVSPAPHTVVQAPPEHTWPAAHAAPHEPQFAGSLWVSVQTPPHRCPPL